MDADQDHPFTISYVGAVVIYFFGVQKAPLTKPDGTFSKPFVRNVITDCGNIRNPPAHMVAINNVAPAQLLKTDRLYFCLLRNVDDNNDVFLDVPNIRTLRRTWSVIYCNMSTLDLTVTKNSVSGTRQSMKWDANDIFHGMLHLRSIHFKAYEHEVTSDEDENPGPAPREVPTVDGLLNQLQELNIEALERVQATAAARIAALVDEDDDI